MTHGAWRLALGELWYRVWLGAPVAAFMLGFGLIGHEFRWRRVVGAAVTFVVMVGRGRTNPPAWRRVVSLLPLRPEDVSRAMAISDFGVPAVAILVAYAVAVGAGGAPIGTAAPEFVAWLAILSLFATSVDPSRWTWRGTPPACGIVLALVLGYAFGDGAWPRRVAWCAILAGLGLGALAWATTRREREMRGRQVLPDAPLHAVWGARPAAFRRYLDVALRLSWDRLLIAAIIPSVTLGLDYWWRKPAEDADPSFGIGLLIVVAAPISRSTKSAWPSLVRHLLSLPISTGRLASLIILPGIIPLAAATSLMIGVASHGSVTTGDIVAAITWIVGSSALLQCLTVLPWSAGWLGQASIIGLATVLAFATTIFMRASHRNPVSSPAGLLMLLAAITLGVAILAGSVAWVRWLLLKGRVVRTQAG